MNALLGLDRAFFHLCNGQPWPAWLDAFFVFITEDENPVLRIFMVSLWLFLLLACGPNWRRRALWLLPLIGLSDGLNSHLVKDLFARVRPCQEGLEGLRLLVDCGPAYSFPSSHAANMGAVGIFLALGVKGWWRRALVLLLPVLVAHSRVHVGVHYPLDVLAGFLEGGLLALFIEFIRSRLPYRWGGLAAPAPQTGQSATVQ